jgi:peroxiredoxin
VKKIVFLMLVFLATVKSAIGNTLDLKPFILKGSINIDTGSIQLEMAADSSLYPIAARNLTAKIVKGKFTFEGTLPNPLGFRLLINQKYFSELIVVDPGLQTVICKIESVKDRPVINNRSMAENSAYLKMFAEISSRRASFSTKQRALYAKYHNVVPDSVKMKLDRELKSLYEEGDRTLVRFIEANPDSYLAFWKLASLLRWGFEPNLLDAHSQLSDSLKNSNSGKELNKLIARSKALSIGEIFPLVSLVDVEGLKTTTKEFPKNKFTLIDFWYSHCSPCIAQFPDLRKLYVNNKERGFSIIGISTDAAKFKQDWLAAIKKYDIEWSHYWDVDGKGATELSIKAFPTNFLLDDRGRIVKKNISPAELAFFLSENL